MASYGPNLAVGDIFQVISVVQATDQIGLNVFHYQVTTTSGLVSLGTMVTALESDGFGTKLRALLSASVTFKGLLVRRVFPTLGLQFVSVTDAGVGDVAGDLLPRQVSGLIRKISGEAIKGSGGRFYIPFPGEGDNAATSVPTAGYVTRLDTLRATLFNGLSGATWSANPVIFHRGSPPPDDATDPPYGRPIREMISSPLWATQRRRGSYGRTNTSPIP